MSIIKFRKVRELFPNRKVRIVRTEQLWFVQCLYNYSKYSILQKKTSVHPGPAGLYTVAVE